MRQPLWSRRRRDADDARPGTDGPPTDGAEATTEAGDAPPTGGRVDAGPSEIRARLHMAGTPVDDPADPGGDDPDGGPAPADRQAAYAAWAERMRSHKKDKLAGIVPDPDDDADEPPPTSPYWDPANLFDSDGDRGPADPVRMGNTELFALLELSEGASMDEVHRAYRRLAKTHHPDRWVGASPEVRAQHQATMALIAEAHSELRRRLG